MLEDWCLDDIDTKLNWFLRFQNHGVMPNAGGGDDQPEAFWQAVNVLTLVAQFWRIELELPDSSELPRLE